MLIFVDYEHESRYEMEGVDWLLAARTRITYRLEDLSSMHCMLVRYDRLTPELLAKLDPKAIFISGQGTDVSKYRPEDTEVLANVIRAGDLPVFGFCGGWQFMATALGGELVTIEVPDERRGDDIITEWPGGRVAEFGYYPVDTAADAGNHPLMAGMSDMPTFRHAHGLHIPELPRGFQTLASTPVTPIQLAATNDDRRMVGTQFHPEYWTDEHPDGQTLIVNFLSWANVT